MSPAGKYQWLLEKIEQPPQSGRSADTRHEIYAAESGEEHR
jgi:hypothetical protein